MSLTRGLPRSRGLTILNTTAILHCPRVLAVMAARLFANRSAARQESFLRALARWEWLEARSTRFLTGHFIVLRAVKPMRPEAAWRDPATGPFLAGLAGLGPSAFADNVPAEMRLVDG